ncbi:hypothetical protein Dsin_018694 [Dipteronia sinensis]|uniref:RNase H type-1 domain-containing protein n=1 Tax=Dipteronia sinensis TaxID=43782 RepID=A0AAE0A793_9ROSI|nr:hypothetical protein Dsin_018694 [Dipteronia sinensis]
MVVGLGAAIRDDKGKIVAVLSKPFPGVFSADTGEFLALREGLLLAKNLNLSVQIDEVDAPNVASILNSSAPFLGDASFIVDDIKALCLEVGICKCQAIPRLGNTLAHNLASMALPSLQECSRLDSSLFCPHFHVL